MERTLPRRALEARTRARESGLPGGVDILAWWLLWSSRTVRSPPRSFQGKGQGKQDLLKPMAKTTMMMVMVMELFDG